MALDGTSNLITGLGAFTSTAGFSLSDAHDLTVVGAVNAGTAGLTLTTIGAGSDIIVNNTLTAGTVTLASAATISSNSSGKVVATTLTGSSHGAVTLNAANTITNLGAFTTNGNNAFALTDARDLTVIAAVNAGTAGLTLTTTGAGSDIMVNNTLTAGTVTLVSAATISENAATGKVLATTLIGSSHGVVTLNGANVVTNLGSFTTNGNNAFALTDAHDLTITGAVNAGTAGLTLTTTGAGSDIMVNNTLTGGTVTLASAATITETGGVINATTLTGSSHGATTLNGANVFTNLGAFTTNGNNAFALTDAHDLTVTGAVNAGTAGLTLTTTGAGSDIIVNNMLTGGTVMLASAATISETGGVINATTLTGSSHGATTLNGANVFTNLGAFTTNGNNAFSLTDAHSLNVSGAVNAGTAGLTLATTGGTNAMTLAANLTGGTVTLSSAGTINQTAGVITATTLTGISHGATTLKDANIVTNLGTFTTSGNNAFALTDAHSLNVSGVVNAGTAGLTLATTGGTNAMTLAASLAGGTVTLSSAGTINQTAGVITATTLTEISHGATTLKGANMVNNLGAFTNAGTGGIAFTDARALIVSGAVNGGTGTVALTTTGATANNLTINASVSTSGAAGVVTLISAGNVGESTSTGAVVTHLLNVTAHTGISLTSLLNNIAILGTNTTVTGTKNIHL